MSFAPFLGGMRICLGKTFAEKIAKVMVPIIVTQLEFEFCDPEMKLHQPASTLYIQDHYSVFAKKVASI